MEDIYILGYYDILRTQHLQLKWFVWMQTNFLIKTCMKNEFSVKEAKAIYND